MKIKGLLIALAVLAVAVAAYFITTSLVNRAEEEEAAFWPPQAVSRQVSARVRPKNTFFFMVILLFCSFYVSVWFFSQCKTRCPVPR